MTHPKNLIAIGFWSGPQTSAKWPDVEDFVDAQWDEDERRQVATYLSGGIMATLYMGKSTCRFCGTPNGFADLTDQVYLWPQGLSHYVKEHGVRLPKAFVEHALAMTEAMEEAAVDDSWWIAQSQPKA